MTSIDRRAALFKNIVRLRRAGRELPDNRDIAAVRADLSRELGETVSIRLAARLLGVSHTAVRRWVASRDIPTVPNRDGRVQVPVTALLDLYEDVEAERARGKRRKHILEPAVLRDRDRAERMRTDDLVSARAASDQDHTRAERRALAYHRALGRRLRRSMVDDARHRLWQWQEEGRIDPRYAQRWEEVLSRPVADVRKAIGADTQAARDLRQNSPFAGALSEAERRRIVEQVH